MKLSDKDREAVKEKMLQFQIALTEYLKSKEGKNA